MNVNDFDFRKPPAGMLEKKIAGWLTEACTFAPGKWSRQLSFPAELGLLKSESIIAGIAEKRLPEGAVVFKIAVEGYPKDTVYLGMNRQVLLTFIGGTFGEIFNALPADRALSPIEHSVCGFLIQQLLLDLLQAAWPSAEPIRFSIVEFGAAKIVCTLRPSELIVLGTLSFSGEFGTHPLFLLLPREGCMETLMQVVHDVAPVEPPNREQIESLVKEMPVDLSVILGSAQITLTQLAELQAGDVLILTQKITEPLRAKVGGTDKFDVWPGTVGRRQAVQIESPVAK